MRYVRARPSAVRWARRIARSATRRSCRGCAGLRRRTRPRHAAPRECTRGVRDDAGGGERRAMREERGGAAAAPAPPPRRTRRACCFLVRLGEAFSCTDQVCAARRRGLWAARRLPAAVRDGLIGAAGEQLRGNADEAVVRRIVQRCVPAGRGGHGCHRRHRRRPPTTRRTAPTANGAPVVVLGVHVGKRAEQRCDGRAIVIHRRIDQRRLSTPAHGGAGGGGEPPTDQRYPRTGTRSPYPTRGYTPGSRGAAQTKQS